MSKDQLSRRNFLKAMASGAAAAIAANVIPVPSVVAQGAKYKEAPMLAELVAAGSLPSVDQRLPVNPRVITPFAEVGEYGGTWHRAFKGLSDRWGPVKLSEEGAIQWDAPDADTTNLVANYISEWSQNDNATEYTFKLREGLKWSDGAPFTTEDVQFWYDKMFVTNLFTRPDTLNVGLGGDEANLMKLDVIDELTWKVTFAVPNPLLPIRMGTNTSGLVAGPTMAAPKHYLEKYLGDADTADQALIDAAMQANGVATWQELWYEQAPGDGRGPISFFFRNPELPIINPWRAINTPLDDPWVMERNPYYHAVDTEGNQLPYIDKVSHALFEDTQTLNLWVAQGLIDMQSRHISSIDFTFFKENEDAGDYHVVTWRSASTNAFHPNISHPDPEKAALFDTAEFREALSIAINRQELNDLVYNGLLKPRQASPVSGSPQYMPEFESKWIEYDPDRANQLLDGLGFTERDADGYRMKDGKTLGFTITYTEALGSMNPDEVGVVSSYWEAIGIKVSQEVLERSLLEERDQAGDIEVGVWYVDRSSVVMADPRRYLGTISDGPWASRYANYMASMVYGDGTTTTTVAEPPADHPIRRLHELWDLIQKEPDEAKRNAMMTELLSIHVEHPYMIGTVGEDPTPIIVKNNMFNVGSGFISDDSLRNEGIARPKQFFFRST
ncbi:MAG TPA: ABC transporter substrate-binding protein [Phototrophicaceae bacterium]|nr:ABC transporter substrate-binding protein [Phototrophicaceae bacterium]